MTFFFKWRALIDTLSIYFFISNYIIIHYSDCYKKWKAYEQIASSALPWSWLEDVSTAYVRCHSCSCGTVGYKDLLRSSSSCEPQTRKRTGNSKHTHTLVSRQFEGNNVLYS